MTVVEDLLFQEVPQDKTIINELKFKDNLCHVCNKKIPKFEYCHKMYGGKFKRMYGWYINVEKFKLGIDPVRDVKKITIDDYPSEVKELLEEISSTKKPLNYWQLRESGYSKQEREHYEETSRELSKLSRKLSKYFENIVRLKLGYKKVGEGWVTETSLFYMIKNILPESKVIHHYHPPELGGLELDIFIQDLNIGIEYQGIQHFKPVKH